MRDLIFDADGSAPKSPESAAQKHMRPVLPKRFYKTVSVETSEQGASVLLDGKAIKTPAKQPLLFPNTDAAKLSAKEWEAQNEHVNAEQMPVTRLVNTAIDGISKDPQAVLEDIVRFASNDLLCYRAEHPERLVETQRSHWDPILDWVFETTKAQFETTTGITHLPQSKEAISLFSARLSAHADPIKLACLHTFTSLSGSALIAYALAESHLDLNKAWDAAHVDEDFNISQWGEDHEAAKRRKNRFIEMKAAYSLFGVL